MTDFVDVNRRAWDSLARGESSASTPWPPGRPDELKSWLDEFGWLPWDEIRSVLVLCGAGGQQAPAFAALGLQVTLVDVGKRKQLDLQVIVPIEDMANPGLEDPAPV